MPPTGSIPTPPTNPIHPVWQQRYICFLPFAYIFTDRSKGRDLLDWANGNTVESAPADEKARAAGIHAAAAAPSTIAAEAGCIPCSLSPVEDFVTDWVEQFVRDMGYLGLAFLTFLENVFPPIPSEIILPLGGYLSTQQPEYTFIGVVGAGVVGSLAGALVLYYLGCYFNEPRLKRWVSKHGHWLLLDPEDIDEAVDWFERHGRKAVFICRIIPGARSLISIPAGSSGMKMRVFLLYTTLGTAIWSTALAYAGRLLGQNYSDVGNATQWATYAVIATVIGTIIWWILRKRANNTVTQDENS